ncbi:MAG: hypothetical protein ACP5JF_06400 [Candidatus Methanodesulfokora sp.]|jgi:septal ring factor EnvC (AmiA/AmiB activator)
MQQSLAERVMDEIEADKRLRKRLAELIVSEPDIRLVLINSVIADVATKSDIKELRAEMNQFRAEMNQLRAEMNQLRAEMNQLRAEMSQMRAEFREDINQIRSEINQLRAEVHSDFKWIVGILLAVWGSTVIPLLLKLAGAI